MTFSDISKKAQKFTIDNSPMILTVIGATGVVATAALTGRAAFRASDVLREEALKKAFKGEVAIHENDLKPSVFSLKEQVNLTWKLYIPAVAVGVTTLAAVIGANQIGTKRTAALAAAYSLSQTAVEEYRAKVIEKLGEKKEIQIRDEVAQDRLNSNPLGDREVIIAGLGGVDCYDQYSGRYFKSSYEEIKSAQNNLNYIVNNNGYASLNEFYDLIGLSRVDLGDEVGWNTDKLLDIHIGTLLTDKSTPCLTLDYRVKPVRDYYRFR